MATSNPLSDLSEKPILSFKHTILSSFGKGVEVYAKEVC